jgi:outer membrane protein
MFFKFNVLFIFFVSNLFSMEINLEKALKMVKTENPEIKQLSWGEEVYRGLHDEAKAAFFPKLEMTGIVAPMYSITGDVNSSEKNYSTWKPYYLLDARVVLPIFTFGKASKLKKAAKNGIEVAKSETRIKELKTILQTKEYYFTYQMAKTLFGVITSTKGFIESAMETASKMLAKKDGSIKKQDLLQMKVYYAKIQKYHELGKKGLIVAKSAVLMQMGQNEGDLTIKDWKLEPLDFEIKPLDYYVDLARLHRPEYKMAKHGLIALKSYKEAKKADHYPNLFVGTQLKYRKTNNVTDQKSVFVNDEYNDMQPGIGIGFQWNFDYATTKAKIRQAHGEYMKIVEQNNFAQIAIPTDIKRCYYDLIEAKKNVDNFRPAVKAANEWKIIEMSNYTLGIGEAEDLLKSIGADALTRYDYYEAILQFNLAAAKLSVSVGKEITNLKY